MRDPFNQHDFECTKSSIADLINDLIECTHLYPNTLKKDAFEKYYTKEEQSSVRGYVAKGQKIYLMPKDESM